MSSVPQNKAPCCPACRRRFLLPLSNATCDQCVALADAGVQPGSPRFVEIQNWPQCKRCSASSKFLHVTVTDGVPQCGDCIEATPPVAPNANPYLPAGSRTQASSPAPVPSFASPEGSAAAAVALARRSEATAVRLRKVTPSLSMAVSQHQGTASPALTAGSSTTSAPQHPTTQTLNAFRHGHGAPGESQITVILFFKLSTKPNKPDPQFGKVIRNFASSRLLPDVVHHVLESQFNQIWVKQYGSSLQPQTELSLRLCGNNLLEDGTANLSLADFYKHYENHPSGVCSAERAKSLLKTNFNKKVLILELLAEVEIFKKRTEVNEAIASVRTPAESISGTRRKRSRMPSVSAMPASRLLEAPSKVPPAAKIRAASVPTAATPGYSSIHFRRFIPRIRESVLGNVKCSLVVDNGDLDDSDYLIGEVRMKDELARGSMKSVFEAKFRNKLYVAKKYFRLSDARTRQKISTEDNSKALKSELMRYGIAAHYLKLFFEVAADALIEVDKRIEVTNAFIAEEENGATWLFEPRITSAQPIKYCGTLHHAVPADNLTAKTVHAFIHFVTRRSLGTLILADVQGSTGRLERTGQDGIILFDFMTHTPNGSSGPGDHGRIGINAYWSGHQCNPICDTFKANGLFKTSDEPSSDEDRPAKKRRIAETATHSRSIYPRSRKMSLTVKEEDSEIEEIPPKTAGNLSPSLPVDHNTIAPLSDADGAPLLE